MNHPEKENKENSNVQVNDFPKKKDVNKEKNVEEKEVQIEFLEE